MDATLLVAGLHVDPDELTPERTARLPSLPSLARLLRFGDRTRLPPSVNWRRLLATDLGLQDLATQPVARIAAASRGEPGRCDWLAQPVHLQPALDHLRLHPAGLLRLDPGESMALAAAFADVFGAEGYDLQPLPGGSLLLKAPVPLDAVTADPVDFVGGELGAAPPRGPDAGALRRLMTEIEMWLHDGLPLNRDRSRRGLLPVNGLWLWGGGASIDLPAPRQKVLPRLLADDAFVHGLARLAGGRAEPLPATFPSTGAGAQRFVAVVDAVARDLRDQPLLRLEQDWIAPALEALGQRRIERLVVIADGERIVLGPGARWRLWRRDRPWWQALGQGPRE
jgi:hypothetical protein